MPLKTEPHRALTKQIKASLKHHCETPSDGKYSGIVTKPPLLGMELKKFSMQNITIHPGRTQAAAN